MTLDLVWMELHTPEGEADHDVVHRYEPGGLFAKARLVGRPVYIGLIERESMKSEDVAKPVSDDEPAEGAAAEPTGD